MCNKKCHNGVLLKWIHGTKSHTIGERVPKISLNPTNNGGKFVIAINSVKYLAKHFESVSSLNKYNHKQNNFSKILDDLWLSHHHLKN